jgi:hypothetical protein
MERTVACRSAKYNPTRLLSVLAARSSCHHFL